MWVRSVRMGRVTVLLISWCVCHKSSVCVSPVKVPVSSISKRYPLTSVSSPVNWSLVYITVNLTTVLNSFPSVPLDNNWQYEFHAFTILFFTLLCSLYSHQKNSRGLVPRYGFSDRPVRQSSPVEQPDHRVLTQSDTVHPYGLVKRRYETCGGWAAQKTKGPECKWEWRVWTWGVCEYANLM